MFCKLAARNVRRSFRDYGVYLLTLTFGVGLKDGSGVGAGGHFDVGTASPPWSFSARTETPSSHLFLS